MPTDYRVRCGVCGVSYSNKAPMLVMREIDGKRTMAPPEPDADWWKPDCRCGAEHAEVLVDGEVVSRVG